LTARFNYISHCDCSPLRDFWWEQTAPTFIVPSLLLANSDLALIQETWSTFINLTGNARRDGRWKIDNTTQCGTIQMKVTFAIKRALHQRAHAHDNPEGGLFKITCELSTPIRARSVRTI